MQVESDAWWESLVSGASASLVAAVLFLAIMAAIRPRLRISNRIARCESSDGRHRYLFKIVNRSPRSVTDLQVQVFLVRPRNSVDGVVNYLRPLEVRPSGGRILTLPGWRPRDKENRFARRITICADLSDIWTDASSYIVVRMVAADSLSNFTKVFEKRYHTLRTAVEDGDFEVGLSMKVR